jgi:hypothetical protein
VIAQRATPAEKLSAFLGILGDAAPMNVRIANHAATCGDAHIAASAEVEHHRTGIASAGLGLWQHAEMIASCAVACVARFRIER